jgi:hypothetical protein
MLPHATDEEGTRGFGIVSSPTSDNLNQETTNQADLEVGTDGAGLSCPGSSVVADEDDGARAVRRNRQDTSSEPFGGPED